jgi:hypothetical protein
MTEKAWRWRSAMRTINRNESREEANKRQDQQSLNFPRNFHQSHLFSHSLSLFPSLSSKQLTLPVTMSKSASSYHSSSLRSTRPKLAGLTPFFSLSLSHSLCFPTTHSQTLPLSSSAPQTLLFSLSLSPLLSHTHSLPLSLTHTHSFPYLSLSFSSCPSASSISAGSAPLAISFLSSHSAASPLSAYTTLMWECHLHHNITLPLHTASHLYGSNIPLTSAAVALDLGIMDTRALMEDVRLDSAHLVH